MVGLPGRNGAGKTTTLRTITGYAPARAGRILVDGREEQWLALHKIPQLGVGLVPSGRWAFGDLSVRQRLLLAAQAARIVDDPWTVEGVVETFPKLAELMERRVEVL